MHRHKYKMRWKDIMEAPISDMGNYGNMDTEGSFRNSDLKALRNPKWAQKVRDMFEKVPFDINVYFYNVPDAKMAPLIPLSRQTLSGFTQIDQIDLRNTSDFSAQAGAVPLDKIKPIIGKIPENYKAAINCVLMNNEGDGRMAMTPWMVGHRIIHALTYDTQRNGRQTTEHHVLFNTFSHIINTTERWLNSNAELYPQFRNDAGKARNFGTDTERVNAIAKVLGTTRAAREGNHINAGEWLVDIMTQWLVRGTVKFTRPDFCEVGITEPKPQPADTPLFRKAVNFYRTQMNSGWRGLEDANNPHAFSDSIIRTHHDKPDPNSGTYTRDHVVAIDPKTDKPVASISSASEDRIQHYRDKGFHIEIIKGADLLARDLKTYEAYMKRKNKFETQYKQWLDDEVLGIPGSRGSTTDKCHATLGTFEQEISKDIEKYMHSMIGRFYVL